MRTYVLPLRHAAALIACAVLVISGVPSAVRAQHDHTSVTINFWQPLGDPLARSLLVPYLQQFEKSHPGITVNFVVVSGDNNYVKYTTAMAAGRGPDVIMTTSFNPPVPEWAANGFIQPLDPWFNQLHVSREQWLPWVWDMQTFHGHTWGFMQQYDSYIFVWNKQLFKQAGLDPNRPPRTLAELDAYARKLTKFDANGKLVQAGFVPWVWPQSSYHPQFWPALFGGQLFDSTRNVYTLNSPAAIKALTWLGTYAKMLGGPQSVNGLMGQFQGNNDPFYTGQVAMAITGEWAPAFIPMFAPKFKYGVNYGAAAPPTAPGVPYGTNYTNGGDTFVMPVGTKHPQEAVEFMLYMMGHDPLMAWCMGEANIPPTKPTIFDPRYLKAAPASVSLVATARLAIANPQILRVVSTSAINDYAVTAFEEAQQEVLYGRASAKAALDKAQQVVAQREAS